MQIKYIEQMEKKPQITSEQDIQNFANGLDIPFNIVE